jgi:hypothetical protein
MFVLYACCDAELESSVKVISDDLLDAFVGVGPLVLASLGGACHGLTQSRVTPNLRSIARLGANL